MFYVKKSGHVFTIKNRQTRVKEFIAIAAEDNLAVSALVGFKEFFCPFTVQAVLCNIE